MSEGGPAAGACRLCGTALIYPGQTICQHCGGQTNGTRPASSAPQPGPAPQNRVLWPGQWPPQNQGQPQGQWQQPQRPLPPQGQWQQPPRPQQPGPIQPQLQYPQPWQQPRPQPAPRLQPAALPAAARTGRRAPVLPAILVSLVVAGIVPVIAVLMAAPGKAEPSIAPTTGASARTAAPTATPTPHPTINVFPATDPLTPVGSLKDARSNHTATLLADGRVVILGGISSREGRAATDYVEIYDPKSKSFGLAGKSIHARYDHTATLLKNGTILLAGGRASQDGAPVAAAEVYDPKTRTSREVGAMAVPRYEASAVLLDDGRVLIAGGSDQNGWILEPEVYDPRTAKFTSLGRVSWAVGTVPIVRMGDGRVLVAGGGAAGQATNAAMIYDPKKNRFIGPDEGAGSIEVSRTESTSCRLAKSGQILIAGGMGPDGVDATAEIYVMGRYEMGQPEIALVSPRVHHTLTALPDGGALIVGGEAIYGQPTASVERWKPNSSSTVPIGTMSRPRSHHTATLLKDGTVLIAGGRSSLTTVLADAAIYRP